MISLRQGDEIRRPAVATYPPGATFGPRTLQSFELVWVISGHARWAWLDTGAKVSLEPGVLLLLRPGMRDAFAWSTDSPTRHGYVHFHIYPRPDASAWPLTRPVAAPGPLGGLLDYLLWLADEAAPDWLTHAERTIAALLDVFIAAPLPDHDSPDEHPALAAALSHVRQQWSVQMRPLTLTELAKAAGVSKEHLARLFQHRSGAGLIRALDLVRLDRAATLLTHSNLTITEVAKTCGFADPLHFSKRFASVYGVPPRSYRREGSHWVPLAQAGLLSLASRLTHHLSPAAEIVGPG